MRLYHGSFLYYCGVQKVTPLTPDLALRRRVTVLRGVRKKSRHERHH